MPSRRLLAPTLLLTAFALGGCKAKFETKDDDRSGNVQIAMGANDSGAVSIDTPVFKADVKLPKLAFGGEHMDLDGIKLYPGSTVTGVNVDAQDRPGNGNDKGVVRIAFSSAAAPAALVDYYAKAARDNGYAEVAAAGSTVHATRMKDGKPKALDVAVQPAASGSAGSITLPGE